MKRKIIEFVKLVIRKCPSLLAEPNIKGETPLHIAARFGHKNIVEFLIHSIKKAQFEDLERGADASTTDKMLKKTSTDEDTALHEAVRNNHPQVVEILIRENPEFANIANAAGESPLYLAAGLTARFLKSAGYKRGRPVIQLKSHDSMSIVDNELIRIFEETSKSHQIVATLIATVTFAAGFTVPGGYSNNDGPDEGTAILTRRSAFKTFLVTDTLALTLSISVVLIHFLLALQPSNRKIFFLFTWAFIFTVVAMELMVVAFVTDLNLLPVVEVLLELDKSDAYIGKNDGRTPLHLAIRNGRSHLKVVEKIMSGCPDCCDLADNGGRNVLHFAVETNTYKVTRTITEHASLANLINQEYKEGNTPVHLVAAIGFFPLGIINHRLVDKKAVNKGNLTALDVVLATKHESLQPLVGKGLFYKAHE
ncbi:hypothetical protein GH714_029978 [Hevea brasiliensis]|uniref:PGG domain-containing protein n=1 Tax=Hevea brasiliensis TaxID=3981 RepID=A0A6A6N3B5_HEVBR|nr:hypothetical protein GH714_029978 [Hevea brasiliensis]